MSIALDARSATGSTSRRGTRSAVLLDSHPLLLEIVERVLEAAGVTTVSKETTAEEALDAVREHRPDLFLLDLRNAGGVESIQEARQLVPGLKTIVLADTADDAVLAAAFAAGTTVAISRSASPDDLALAARQAFEPSIFLAHTRRAAPAPPPPDPLGDPLTKREREILCLVAEGYTNGRVGKLLWVTEQTVKFHLSNIYRKLEVGNRTEASRWAQRHGLLAEAPAAA